MKRRQIKKQLHHFVPQWYLREFLPVDSTQLKCFDFRTKMYGDRNPTNIMAINDYYKQESKKADWDPYVLEEFFSKVVEAHGKSAYQRLLSMATDIRPEETLALLALVETQRLRVPRQARLMKQLYESQIEEIHGSEFAAAYRRGDIELTEAYRFEAMRLSLGKMMAWCGQMDWSVIKAPAAVSFVTTDSPVVFFNPLIQPPAEAGLAFAGTKVLFPLSARQMLMMYHPECRRFDPLHVLPDPPKEDRGINVHFWPEPIDEDGARMWNRLMVHMCDHTVVGASQDDIRYAVDHPLIN